MWVGITLLSLKLQIWRLLEEWSFVTFRKCRFTVKLARDMIITYSSIHLTVKYSKHSSTIQNYDKLLLNVRLQTKSLWFWVALLLLTNLALLETIRGTLHIHRYSRNAIWSGNRKEEGEYQNVYNYPRLRNAISNHDGKWMITKIYT